MDIIGEVKGIAADKSLSKDPNDDLYQEIIDQLIQKFPHTKLVAMAPDMYFNPTQWQLKINSAACHRINTILGNILIQHQPEKVHIFIEDRLKQIWKNPFENTELTYGKKHHQTSINHYYLPPWIRHCFRLLANLKPTPEILTLIKRILIGEFNYGPFQIPHINTESPPEMKVAYRIYNDIREFNELLNYFCEHGELTYEIFTQCVSTVPTSLQVIGKLPKQREATPCEKTLNLWHQRLLDEVVDNLTETNYEFILYSHLQLSGAKYLVKAAQYHAQFELGKLVYMRGFRTHIDMESAIIHLAQSTQIEPESPDERQALIKQLRQIPAESLESVLPFTSFGRRIICEALGWDNAIPLVDLLVKTADLKLNKERRYVSNFAYNSPDPTSGVVDINPIKRIIAHAGDVLAQKVFTLFQEAEVGINNTIYLFEAVVGWNRADIEKRLKRNAQIVIMAYGILPLEHGEEEVLQRYHRLQAIAKDGVKFGQMRQESHARAVQVALANLAQIAGYPNASRLELAMEHKINQEIALTPQTWKLGNYHINIAIDGSTAAIKIDKGNRTLKSVPKIVRQSKEYKKAKEMVAHFRAQVTRFRNNLLEPALLTQETFTPQELKQLLAMPALREMMSRLIVMTADNQMGLLKPEEFSIELVNGELQPIDTPVSLAHSYHLFQADQLAAWQRKLVHRRIKQPFKQVFRELYLITPAERETYNCSNRFGGHTVAINTTAKLLNGRGWKYDTDDIPRLCKTFDGICAVFEFPDAYHYFGGSHTITTDRIYFEPYPMVDPRSNHEESWIPLEDIPPLIFSEVMRDADLAISVAARDGDVHLSKEVFEQRSTLVTALLDDLGLSGVTIKGHFAHVQGKLANYRVHLGSAVIHIEPGHYLCVVPDGWGRKHDKLFLPFSDKDTKTSEVISKILLLLSDDKIKDETILHQIQRH